VPKDDFEAVKWYRKAAEQNHALAQVFLGSCYANGRAVAKDEAEAVKWLHKAAELNCVPAQTLLGLCYVNAQGVPQDFVKGHAWLSLGAANGAEIALEDLPLIEKFMTPRQKAEAAKLASELLEKFKSLGLAAITAGN
jgi:TPR repeat protein